MGLRGPRSGRILAEARSGKAQRPGRRAAPERSGELRKILMIPSVEYGGVGETVYFLHANGYPPDCYRPLLVRLAERYRVRAMLQRPLWASSDPQEIEDWIPLSDDLLRFLDQDHAVPG